MMRFAKKYLCATFLFFQSLSSYAGAFLNFDQPHVPGQMIIKFKSNFKATASNTKLQDHDLKIQNRFSTTGAIFVQSTHANSFSTYDTQILAQEIASWDEVEYVEANTIIRLKRTPQDPSFAKSWNLHNDGQTGGTPGMDIKALEAWDINTGSKQIKVAVIDTGVQYDHPDLKGNIWTNPGESGIDAKGNDKTKNGSDDDGNGFIDDIHGWNFVDNNNDPMDKNGHGTHCAGVIGAVSNQIGIVGVNWNVSIVPIRFMDPDGNGELKTAILSIEYATKLGVDIMSNSWGSSTNSPTMGDAIKKASDKGILFIAASGNDTEDTDKEPSFPANYTSPNVISVAAIDHNGNLADFSNFGLKSVHLAAPGSDIYSTWKSSSYKVESGTSMATPHVAGLAALMLAQRKRPMAEIKSKLLSSVTPLPSLAGKTVSGGMINAYKALSDSVDPNPDPNSNPKPLPGAQLIQVDQVGNDWALVHWQPKNLNTNLEIKISPRPLDTEEEWTSGQQVAYAMISGGQAKLAGLPKSFNGYVSLRVKNTQGDLSPLGVETELKLLSDEETSDIGDGKQVLDRYDGKSLKGIHAESPWGISGGQKSFYSYNPDRTNSSYASSSLTLSPLSTQKTHSMSFFTWYLMDSGDYGSVDLSYDAWNWYPLTYFEGQSKDWETIKLDLKPYLPDNISSTSLYIRFQMHSDSGSSFNRFALDEITIFGKK